MENDNPQEIEKYLNIVFKCKRCHKKTVRKNPDTKLYECCNKRCKARFTLLEITKL